MRIFFLLSLGTNSFEKYNSYCSILSVLWSECSLLSNSYVKIFTLKVMVVGGRAFRIWLGFGGRSLMNVIRTLIEEA
jgi:hypothetical protein